eukprot:3279608-Prymnesium_polylepis.1
MSGSAPPSDSSHHGAARGTRAAVTAPALSHIHSFDLDDGDGGDSDNLQDGDIVSRSTSGDEDWETGHFSYPIASDVEVHL